MKQELDQVEETKRDLTASLSLHSKGSVVSIEENNPYKDLKRQQDHEVDIELITGTYDLMVKVKPSRHQDQLEETKTMVNSLLSFGPNTRASVPGVSAKTMLINENIDKMKRERSSSMENKFHPKVNN